MKYKCKVCLVESFWFYTIPLGGPTLREKDYILISFHEGLPPPRDPLPSMEKYRNIYSQFKYTIYVYSLYSEFR